MMFLFNCWWCFNSSLLFVCLERESKRMRRLRVQIGQPLPPPAHTSSATAMATITNLSDPLVKTVVAHVFNKYRADVVGKDGKAQPSKVKYRDTSAALLARYGLSFDAKILKQRNVRGARSTRRMACVRSPTGSLTWCAAACCCSFCVGARQTQLEEHFKTLEFELDESGYESPAMMGKIALRYIAAGKTAGSRPSQGESSASASSTRASVVQDMSLKLIQGELANMNDSLRIIAASLTSGSRMKVKKSLENLLNTPEDDDESGQSFRVRGIAVERQDRFPFAAMNQSSNPLGASD